MQGEQGVSYVEFKVVCFDKDFFSLDTDLLYIDLFLYRCNNICM